MASNDVSRLAISRAYMFIAFATMILMSLVGIGLIASALLGSKDPPQFVVVLWCGALAWNWYVLLTIPYEIRFDSIFVSLACADAHGQSIGHPINQTVRRRGRPFRLAPRWGQD